MVAYQNQPDEDKLSTLEKKAWDRSKKFAESGRGYAIEHGSRPSTIGHVLSSNPLAMLAW
jgi:microsomal epoxide hydrolase